jgi:hypothetical protein
MAGTFGSYVVAPFIFFSDWYNEGLSDALYYSVPGVDEAELAAILAAEGADMAAQPWIDIANDLRRSRYRYILR